MAKPKLRFPEFTDEWEKCCLSNLITEKPKNGFSPEPVNHETEFRVLSISAVTTGTFRGEYYKYTDCSIDKAAHCWVKNEDILIQRSNTAEFVGVSAIYEGEDNKYIYPDLLMKVHAKEGVNSKFLSYYLIMPNTRQYYKRNACGTSGNMPKINQKTVLNTPLYITNIIEQSKIAKFLSSVADIIQMQEEEISTLEDQKKGIMWRLFNREVRFKRDDGSEYPEWGEKMVGDFCSVQMCKRIFKEQTQEKGEIPFYKIGTIGSTPDAYISRELFEQYKSKYNYPHPGEFLISCSGTVGRCVIYDGQDAYYQDSNIVWLRNNDVSVLNSFLYLLVSNVNWKCLNSTTITRIYGDDLRQLRFLIPCIEEQQKIADCLSAYDEAIQIKKDKLEVWKEINKGLLQQMFV